MHYPDKVVEIIKNGGVVAMPTDTIFGLVASALDQKAIEKIYEIKGRDWKKPCVVLISRTDQLKYMKIDVDTNIIEQIKKIWTEPVSVILPCPDPSMRYLHRGKDSLAVRLPNISALRKLVEKTGPIIATSVNKSRQPALNDLDQIKTQFPTLDFYVDGDSALQPSKLVRLRDDNTLEWLKRS